MRWDEMGWDEVCWPRCRGRQGELGWDGITWDAGCWGGAGKWRRRGKRSQGLCEQGKTNGRCCRQRCRPGPAQAGGAAAVQHARQPQPSPNPSRRPAAAPAAVDEVGDLEVAGHAVSQLFGVLGDLGVQVDGGGVLQGGGWVDGGKGAARQGPQKGAWSAAGRCGAHGNTLWTPRQNSMNEHDPVGEQPAVQQL
jgi:hypothetical protein